jgi:hypothetical protein
VTVLIGALLAAHLFFASLATIAFWVPAVTPKGGATHRAAGRWFARLVTGAAITGGLLAVLGLIAPARMFDGAVGLAAVEMRRLMWLILYFLLLIVVPVQHGLAVVAAANLPVRVRSPLHATFNLLSIAAALIGFPAAIAWHAWTMLLVAPAGFIIGLRNMQYASRPAATRVEWEREHLTSLLTAGIALHTAFFVLTVLRWPWLLPAGPARLAPWLVPAAVGLPAIVWNRKRRNRF